MKIKIEFAAFVGHVSAPAFLAPQTTMARGETKHTEVEMEYDTEGAILILRMTKDTKPLIIPATNIKSMVASELQLSPPVQQKK